MFKVWLVRGNGKRATLSSVAKESRSDPDTTTWMNNKTDLHKYKQKNSVRAQAHECRRPTLEQEPWPFLLKRLSENLQHPFLPGLYEGDEESMKQESSLRTYVRHYP